jgi:hypothetical protein
MALAALVLSSLHCCCCCCCRPTDELARLSNISAAELFAEADISFFAALFSPLVTYAFQLPRHISPDTASDASHFLLHAFTADFSFLRYHRRQPYADFRLILLTSPPDAATIFALFSFSFRQYLLSC